MDTQNFLVATLQLITTNPTEKLLETVDLNTVIILNNLMLVFSVMKTNSMKRFSYEAFESYNN